MFLCPKEGGEINSLLFFPAYKYKRSRASYLRAYQCLEFGAVYINIWIQSATLLKDGHNKPQHLISNLHFHSFLTRFRAALAELDRSAWENMMKTCMTPVTSAIPAAVNAAPLHVDRSCVHLKNLMAPNNRRNDQNRVTWSISGNRKSAARRHINTFRMHIR